MNIFKALFLVGLILMEVVRFPHRKRQRKEWREKRIAETRLSPLDFTLEMLAFAGMEIIPLVYILSPWLDFADYRLPVAARWLGVPFMLASIWLLRRAHADLGHNWSPTLQIAQEHRLVTGGIYARIRHPIYASVWLMGLAQILLLANWIAGPACLVLFLPVYLVRVPREERMMLDHFGQQYREYLQRTGRVFPQLRK